MGNRILSFIGKKVNRILSCINLQLQVKNNKFAKPKYKKHDYIWDKISRLPKTPTIIDIGVGPTGTPALYKHFSDSSFIFIDPLEECKQAVEKYLQGESIFIVTAVGSTNHESEINIARKPSRSSFFRRTHSYKSMGVTTRIVSVKRLDDIISGLKLQTPYGIKIDTEGYELEVIKGATQTLKKSLFAIVEFHFIDAAENGYSLQDLISIMEKAGFCAFFMLRDGRNIVFLNRKNNN